MLEQRIGTAGPGVGATSQPPVDATRLDLAASQFIDDMEDKAEVPDRWVTFRNSNCHYYCGRHAPGPGRLAVH